MFSQTRDELCEHVISYDYIRLLINNLGFWGDAKLEDPLTWCFVSKKWICQGLMLNNNSYFFSRLDYFFLRHEVWSRSFRSPACQEGIQEKTATAQGKKVSRTIIFIVYDVGSSGCIVTSVPQFTQENHKFKKKNCLQVSMASFLDWIEWNKLSKSFQEEGTTLKDVLQRMLQSNHTPSQTLIQ